MFRHHDRSAEAAERLQRALDVPQQDTTSDDDINDQLGAARALAPALYPREAWRAALKQRMLREATRPTLPDPASGSKDSRGGSGTHRAEVLNPDLGRVVLADLEPIDGERAESVARAVAHLLDEQAQERRRQ